MEKPVIIFGAGSLGKAAAEIFRSNQVVIYGFLDDDEGLHGSEIEDVSILGRTDDDGFLKYIGKKCEAFVSVDDNAYRKSLVNMLNEKRKVMPMNAVHGDALLSLSAHIGHGNFIDMGVKVGANTTIEGHCIVGSGATINHDVEVGNYVQLGAGSIVNSGVKIQDEAFIGSGAIVVSGVSIGKGARIGAGSVVIADVGKGETVFGNPAQVVNS